jgi:hypothetical protein
VCSAGHVTVNVVELPFLTTGVGVDTQEWILKRFFIVPWRYVRCQRGFSISVEFFALHNYDDTSAGASDCGPHLFCTRLQSRLTDCMPARRLSIDKIRAELA